MKIKATQNILAASLIGALIFPISLVSQDAAKLTGSKATELAQKIQNPVANLNTLSIENSWDAGFGSANAILGISSLKLIYPIHLSSKWNLITRSTLPFVYQLSQEKGGSNTSGLGDAGISLFFSPEKLQNGWVLAGGPVFQIPTASHAEFGAGKWNMGPIVIALRQNGTWTYGMLASHVWSLAGIPGRDEVNTTELFPLLAYTTRKQWTYTIQSDSFYDLTGDQWTIPIQFQLAKLVMIGKQSIEFSMAIRKFTAAPVDGPNWGCGFNITFLFTD